MLARGSSMVRRKQSHDVLQSKLRLLKTFFLVVLYFEFHLVFPCDDFEIAACPRWNHSYPGNPQSLGLENASQVFVVESSLPAGNGTPRSLGKTSRSRTDSGWYRSSSTRVADSLRQLRATSSSATRTLSGAAADRSSRGGGGDALQPLRPKLSIDIFENVLSSRKPVNRTPSLRAGRLQPGFWQAARQGVRKSHLSTRQPARISGMRSGRFWFRWSSDSELYFVGICGVYAFCV